MSVDGAGITVKRMRGQEVVVRYEEVLTAERLSRGRGLVLHIRTRGGVRLRVRGRALNELQDVLRRRGVRIVDCWGAIIAPTLLDFEEELARGPGDLRQSSDSA